MYLHGFLAWDGWTAWVQQSLRERQDSANLQCHCNDIITNPLDLQIQGSSVVIGVTLDLNLSMSQHISNTCKATYIQIRHTSSIRHLLTTQATQTLVCSLVLSRLDYCNSLL